MSYTLLAIAAAIISLLLELFVIRSGVLKQGRFYAAYAIVLVFQFISNGYLTSTEVVQYDPAAIVGLRVWHAPMEDLLFGFALILLTMAIWTKLGHDPRSQGTTSDPKRK